jgi:hypothetical protein
VIAAVLALALTVTPATALAPAEVKARIQVTDEPTARVLEIAILGESREHTSAQPFTPRDGRQTFWIPAWRAVPPGDYVVVATLYDSIGAVVARVVRPVRIVGEQ